MAEIFIPDDTNLAEVDELLKVSRELAATEAEAKWNLWLEEQSETIQALAAEWKALRNARFEFSLGADRHARRLYVCRSKYGHHESYQSFEHALFLLVDAHRTRAEDRPENHARLGGDVKKARAEARALAKKIKEENPRLSGEERDALFMAALNEREGKKPS